MNIKSRVRIALLEHSTPEMNNTDKKVLDFILGENINEAGSLDAINRFISVIKSKQRKFITAAVLTALLANPTFTYSFDHASDNDKEIITKFIEDSGIKTNKQNKGEVDDAKFSLNFSNSFQSGKYEVNQAEVMDKLNSLKNFLTKNSSVKYSIKITSSESQVPNQNGFKIGELANKRSDVMANIVNQFLKSNNISTSIEKATNIGDVPWDSQNKDDEKYTKDQYVKLEVFLSANEDSAPCEISFTKDDGSVSSEKYGYVSFEQNLTESGSMNINPGSIPDRMVIIKNNQIIGDTGYFVDKAHSYNEWNLIPLYIAELTEIAKNSPDIPAISGLKDIKTFNSFEDLLNTLMKKKYDYTKDNRNEIKNGIVKLKQLWDSGQRKFIFYSTKDGTLNYEVSNGEKVKVIVYSPVGKTGFDVQGNCK